MLQKFLDYDIIGTRCIYFGDKKLRGIVPYIPVGNISTFDFKKVNPIVNSSCIVKKDLAFWDSDGLEDYDLWLRLRKQEKSFYNCSQILVKHRIHASSAFNTQSHNNKLQKILSNYSK